MVVAGGSIPLVPKITELPGSAQNLPHDPPQPDYYTCDPHCLYKNMLEMTISPLFPLQFS